MITEEKKRWQIQKTAEDMQHIFCLIKYSWGGKKKKISQQIKETNIQEYKGNNFLR